MFSLLFLTLLGVWGALAQNSVMDVPFLQDSVNVQTYAGPQVSTWQQLPFSESVLQIEGLGSDRYLLLTNQSLYLFQNATTTPIATSLNLNESRIKALSSNTFLLATPNSLNQCSTSGSCTSIVSFSFGPIAALDSAMQAYWIGTKSGLFMYNGQLSHVYVNESVYAIGHALDDSSLAVGTIWRLYVYNGQSWQFHWVGFLIDESVTAIAYDNNNTIWVGNSMSINLVFTNGTVGRINGPKGGLPYNNITALSFQPTLNAMWVGSTKGAMRYSAGSWKYYYGPRWIWGSQIYSIASSDSSYSTIVVADSGVSNITFEWWTLSQKADYYQSMMVNGRHLRQGLAGSCYSTQYLDMTECNQRADDNDGLWTSMYTAAQSFRYAVTKTEDALNAAWGSFNGLRTINEVTGVHGLPARSFVYPNETMNGGTWLNSTALPGLKWKGNTSSDELCGHFFVYPIFHDLVCQTDEEKALPLGLMLNISSYILENDFYLMQDGHPTQWGVWNPAQINDVWFWGDEKGLNSLQILTWFATSYQYSGDQKFMDAFNLLVETYGYDFNAINAKVTSPEDVNYSDDELLYLVYYTAMHSGAYKFMQEKFDISMLRSWNIVRPIKSSLWNTIYGIYAGEDFDIENMVWTLQNWPLSMLDYPTSNSQRLDYFLDVEMQLYGDTTDSLNLLPWDERSQFKWNDDPFTLDGGSGYDEDAPTAWLLPYWMARYYGFISD